MQGRNPGRRRCRSPWSRPPSRFSCRRLRPPCTEGAMPTLDSTPPLVLIASDQEWSGRSLETIIGPRGYGVVRAHTGQQVLETVRSTHVDLLILETRLPDVDGIQLCRRLREQRIVPATTPIIMTTSVQATRASSIAA